MSDKTPMQVLLDIVTELKSNDNEVDTNGLEDWINSVGLPMKQNYVTKEQHKEDVVKAVIDVLTPFDGYEVSCLEETAEEYYKENHEPKV